MPRVSFCFTMVLPGTHNSMLLSAYGFLVLLIYYKYDIIIMSHHATIHRQWNYFFTFFKMRIPKEINMSKILLCVCKCLRLTTNKVNDSWLTQETLKKAITLPTHVDPVIACIIYIHGTWKKLLINVFWPDPTQLPHLVANKRGFTATDT